MTVTKKKYDHDKWSVMIVGSPQDLYWDIPLKVMILKTDSFRIQQSYPSVTPMNYNNDQNDKIF